MLENNQNRKAYLVGGGIGSLAAAAFMIRDGGMQGKNITIYEAKPLLGGSLDAAPIAEGGYSLRGGRMLTTDNYECMWDLYKTIPSLTDSDTSVYDEIVAFNKRVKAHSQARLIDRNRSIVDVSTMGFTMRDRAELLILAEASEEKLGTSIITDWLSPDFFTTNFWYMWQTTFAFQAWHSAVEFKRYLHRFMKEFSRIETLAGVKRTMYNQYDALVRPLVRWLEDRDVQFFHNCTVTDFDLEAGSEIVVKGIKLQQSGTNKTVAVGKDDIVFFQNASMTDASSLGSMTAAPENLTKAESGGWTLWEKLAEGRPELGNPAVFNSSIPESYWASFTVTLNDTIFFDQMEKISGNAAGTGGLVTFKDSNWLMSVVLYHQPHFIDQPDDVQVLWGYALHPDRIGNFVAKRMSDCSGAEILRELAGHLNFDFDETFSNANCIPCRMPYITSMFMPRAQGDRPLPVPKNSKNLALVSQFVEIAEDVVFTVEYSVRAAQMAVYELLGVDRKVPPVTRHDKSVKVNIDAVIKAFK
ncbi:MAG: oleate hydratase [Sphingopyxis sp.]|nr:oleate hydratase [Sphingopyxis sp.]